MLHIYTDGSCKGNPGSGGWSAIIMNQQEDKIIDVLSGTEQNTTNNRMELTAIIKAIEYVNRQPELATIYTDSAYAERSINEWMNRWYFNGWYNSKKKLVENVDLMKILHDYYAKEFVRFEVKKLVVTVVFLVTNWRMLKRLVTKQNLKRFLRGLKSGSYLKKF